ncbi:phosphatidylglycerophosphate phosphatase PTPMT2-like [Raphanus sativus]|uniref:Phosphatidylglycerophosphate phosphatase PTPMT2-like n=1 Tax=Raphanus sativus TaxID=3726 RepID=A0A9W3CZ87_RAPSA|nr:phosphatidylglycerophosphate phosphatase PTPMT2-like [Raphanus sativus]XP_056856924.1 phosphatidylglycerophosphate phosphatase PTPMT2-like [Raphanus sativus]XP_056856925.1 phosphatidylglycerophosphate phosphatase PTPMT2-like [Raphanus sativus]XP_056856926.1 phosphatidylglycerophosphate phosphatase PTPMT2-like [Raphanus sativus]XP_056856927.1 phosphatidylglycerophosphate phosphatase PTPMT2-like [Raphanus sativus]XP_056856928.1 phosphatidylglycerophosphate phosphatase PTPMT2-like [Raphanus sa
MEHLVIPTRDYLFAPSIADITRAVDFIHKNAFLGKTTYVHCKTTIVLCYLIEHKSMTVAAAFEHVRSIRPQVLLHPSQRKVVEKFKRLQTLETFDADS